MGHSSSGLSLLYEVWGLSCENWASLVLDSSGGFITHRSGIQAGMTRRLAELELSTTVPIRGFFMWLELPHSVEASG